MSEQKQKPIPETLAAIATRTEEMFKRSLDQLKAVWPVSGGEFQRALQLIYGQIIKNPVLAHCTPESKLMAAYFCAKLGLSPDPVLGLIYVLPYKGAAKPIMGYKGVLALARRSGQVLAIRANPVFERDQFTYEDGLDLVLRHVPAQADRGDVVAAYAVAEMTNGAKIAKVIFKDRIERARKASASAGSSYSPWNQPDDYPQMATKTAINALAGLLPQSPEFGYALAVEGRHERHEAIPVPDEMLDIIGASELPADEPPPPPVERADVAALIKIEYDGGLRENTVERIASDLYKTHLHALTADQGKQIAVELNRRIQANHKAAMAKRMAESAPREAERLLEAAEAAQEEVRL